MNKSLLPLAALFCILSLAIVISGDFPLFKSNTNNGTTIKSLPPHITTSQLGKHRLCKNIARYTNVQSKTIK